MHPMDLGKVYLDLRPSDATDRGRTEPFKPDKHPGPSFALYLA